MKGIKVLDCTLRDGGYINDWNFGRAAIQDITDAIITTGVDIFEIGFLKNEQYNPDRTVFNNVSQISGIITPKCSDIEYAGMIEVVNPLPLERLDDRTDDTIDIIRVIVWKRLLKEGFEYCKGIIEKGYKLCVQPARVDQYSDEEFIGMIQLFNQINPMAIYVVDSFGTQNKKEIMKYFKLAHRYLNPEISLGYHGHNNLQQAYGIAEAFVEMNLDREIIIDGSIYGIGRGAGNLNLELFLKYLNENHDKNYAIEPLLYIYDSYIKKIYDKSSWGYSMPFYLTALYKCNPDYASYYGLDCKIPLDKIKSILSQLSPTDKIIFKKENAERYLNEFLEP